MKCPLLFYMAYILGFNPYTRLLSRKVYYCFGILNTLYVLLVGAYVLYKMVIFAMSSVVIAAIMFRTSVSVYIIVAGLLEIDSTVVFYERVLTDISEPRESVQYNVDVYCVLLFLTLCPEVVVISGENLIETILFIISASLNTLIPLLTMILFTICCDSVHGCLRRLLEGILNTSSRTTSFTVRRLRLEHVDVVDRVGDVSREFGLRLLVYVLMMQLILLEKADYLVSKFASNNYDINCITVLCSSLGYLTLLWYISYSPSKAAEKHAETLTSLMKLETRNMDASAVKEIAFLAEELSLRPTVFSASGCFLMGFHIFYSVIGIIFSYVMIIAPLAYKKKMAM